MIGCGDSESTDTTTTTNEQPMASIDDATAAIKKDPANADLYFARAQSYYELEGFDEAIIDLDQAIGMDSTKAEYYHLKADVQLDYYRSRDALQTMTFAAQQFPDRIPTLLKLAEFQLILQQYQDALGTVNTIGLKDPENEESYFMLGMIFKETGDTARAINSFQRATEINPEHIESFINAGLLLSSQNKNKSALRFFDNALLIDSTNIAALHSKAFVYQNSSQFEEAVSIWKKINKIDPQYPDAHLNLGLVYLQNDSLNIALDAFTLSTKVEPTFVLGYYYTGITQELLGKPDQAKAAYQQAINLAPSFTRAQEALDALSK